MLLVGIVDDITSRGDGDKETALTPSPWGGTGGRANPCVKRMKVGGGGGIRADAVENSNKCIVALTVYLA